MTLEEFYRSMGVDVDEVINRFAGEERTVKYLRKFLDDTTYEALLRAFEKGDEEEAFRAAHTLKGIALNLSFTPLYQESRNLAELLRGGKNRLADVERPLEEVKREYGEVTAKISSFL